MARWEFNAFRDLPNNGRPIQEHPVRWAVFGRGDGRAIQTVFIESTWPENRLSITFGATIPVYAGRGEQAPLNRDATLAPGLTTQSGAMKKVRRPRKRVIRNVQAKIQSHLAGLLVFQMIAYRLHRWFWNFWSVSLAGLAFTHMQTPNAYTALAVSFAIQLIVMFCEIQEKKAHKEWLER